MRLSLREASEKYGPSIGSLRIRVGAGLLPSYRLHPRGKVWVESSDVEDLMIRMNYPTPADDKAFVKSMKASVGQLLASMGVHKRKRSHL